MYKDGADSPSTRSVKMREIRNAIRKINNVVYCVESPRDGGGEARVRSSEGEVS